MAVESERPFDGLEPDVVLGALEAAGVRCDGHLLALNSYENRVYQIGVEDDAPVIAKFYRPGRWSDEAIDEEHRFALELEAREIPVVAPLRDAQGRSLLHSRGYRYAIFPRRRGGWPELATEADRMTMGRFIARIHAVGRLEPYRHRESLDARTFGHDARASVIESGFVPFELEREYATVSAELVAAAEARIAGIDGLGLLRLHGDCHLGNVLWSETGPSFVDLDDSRTGPAVQDLWMLLSGDREEMRGQLTDLLAGYRQFADFDHREIAVMEALRALRFVYYAAWLARRWVDPAFPVAFPWFESISYWRDHVATLRQQIDAVSAAPLEPG